MLKPTMKTASRATLGIFILILTLSLVLPAKGLVAAAPKSLHPALAQTAAQTPQQLVRVIAQKSSPGSQAEGLVQDLGGTVLEDLSIINALVAEMPAGTVPELARSGYFRWISPDAPVRRSALSIANVRDEFNQVSYSGNDGTQAWAGDWVEINESDGPKRGDERILDDMYDNRLQIRDNDGGGEGVQRQVDLSGAQGATLSFDYRRVELDKAEDYVSVDISPDGGLTWTELDRFSGPATDHFYQHWEADISTYLTSQTTIRFLSSASLGRKDLIYIDNVDIDFSLGEPGPTLALNFVGDDFEAVPYIFHNNSGTHNWTGAWQEVGESDGATSGDIQVINWGEDRGLRFLESDFGVWRTADLSGAASATLYFDFAPLYFEGTDFLLVEASHDGGATWTALDELHGPYSASPIFQSYSYELSAFISSHTAIRFSTDFSDGDAVDVVYLDNVQIIYDNSSVPSLPPRNNYWETANISNAALMGWTGAGVTVAVIDSGITPDVDFGYSLMNELEMMTSSSVQLMDSNLTRVLAQVSLNPETETLLDNYGHGTHVAGIIAGNGSKSNGFYQGVAPGANLISLKVSDDQGMAYESDTVAALQWIYDNKEAYNIRVVNMSLNSTVEDSYHNSPLNAAAEILWFNGVVVVVSSGNYGLETTFNTINAAPANDPFLITVGASHEMGTPDRADDFVALFTARGVTLDGFSKPEVVAPGKDIVSVLANSSWWRNEYPDRFVEGGYFRISGTSMSAPMVAGAAALILQSEPNLTPDQVKYRLMNCSNQISDLILMDFPYLDVHNAMTCGTAESANTGLAASQLLWTGDEPIMWDSVNWNSVNWNSVNWNSVNWNSVNWNSVNWNSVNWND